MSKQVPITQSSTPGHCNVGISSLHLISILKVKSLALKVHSTILTTLGKQTTSKMMFRDSNSTEGIFQDIWENLKLYMICARQYDLSEKRKSDFFIHVFGGAAWNLFFQRHEVDMFLDNMARVLLRKYVSDARQLRVKESLDTLRVRSLIAQKNISDISECLSQIAQLIDVLTSRCP